jgi:hypothetical protein
VLLEIEIDKMPPKTIPEKAIFHYSDNTFYVSASNGQRYRRAEIPELKSHYQSSGDSSKDQVASWYEAQLLHYGLPASKTKSVAKLRLLDAVNSNNINIPSEIQKYEKDLRKGWLSTIRSTKTIENSSKKRKAEDSQHIVPKKTREATIKTKKPSIQKSHSLPTNAKGSPKETKANTKTSTLSTISLSTAKSTPRQTARRGGIRGRLSGPLLVRSTGTMAIDDSSPPKPIAPRQRQTARRSRPFQPRGSQRPEPSFTNGLKQEFVTEERDDGGVYLQSENDDYDEPPSLQRSQGVSGPLGLINGTYRIKAPDLDQWSMYSGDEFTMELRLNSSFVWGYYDFGMYEGVICIPRRPFRASDEQFEFTWRGHDNGEGEMSFGSENRGWIRFLGNGNIEGQINCYGTAQFRGWKESDHVRGYDSMKSEWDRHNQANYDYANQSRWGVSR